MYKHLLIATDGSELATKAIAHGIDLAMALGADVTIVTATEPIWSAIPGEMAIAFPYDEYEKAAAATANIILTAAANIAKTKNVTHAVKRLKDQFPAEGIVAAAKESGCDLIVMASHGRRGLAKLFVGSQAATVVASSTIPVLIYREG